MSSIGQIFSSKTPKVLDQTFSEKAQKNWQNHKCRVLSSGIGTAGLVGTTVAAGVLGGPVGLIVALAAAAFISLALFIRSLFQKPGALKDFSVVKKPFSIVDKSQQIWQKVKNTVASGCQYAKNHPWQTAAMGLALGGAGYGLYSMLPAAAATTLCQANGVATGGCQVAIAKAAPAAILPQTAAKGLFSNLLPAATATNTLCQANGVATGGCQVAIAKAAPTAILPQTAAKGLFSNLLPAAAIGSSSTTVPTQTALTVPSNLVSETCTNSTPSKIYNEIINHNYRESANNIITGARKIFNNISDGMKWQMEYLFRSTATSNPAKAIQVPLTLAEHCKKISPNTYAEVCFKTVSRVK